MTLENVCAYCKWWNIEVNSETARRHALNEKFINQCRKKYNKVTDADSWCFNFRRFDE